jgi:hypothetical protein
LQGLDLSPADLELLNRNLFVIKSLGDRSAHNRHFLAKKEDIAKVTHDLRVVVDELLNLAGLK